jgi:proline iminopeptidase
VDERLIDTVADDGVRLWTDVRGSGPGVMFLHGGPGLWDYLEPLASRFEDSFRVARYDQRGGGRSDRSGPYTISRFVADCECVRRAAGLDQVVVAGHSWGANLSVLYALAHPQRVRGVLYIAGGGFDWLRWRPLYRDEIRRRLSRPEFARLEALRGQSSLSAREEGELNRLTWITDYADRSAAQRHVARMLESGFAVNRTCNRALTAETEATQPDEWHRRVAALRCPVLIVQGSADPRPLASLDGLASALTHCQRVVLDAGHFPWVEAPDEFDATVRAWLHERSGGDESGTGSEERGDVGRDDPDATGTPRVRRAAE